MLFLSFSCHHCISLAVLQQPAHDWVLLIMGPAFVCFCKLFFFMKVCDCPCSSGGRGRGNQGRQGPAGMQTPPGLGKPRHGHRDANGATRPQHEESFPSLPIGTKLQGFVDHVRENFGFIRSAAKHFQSPHSHDFALLLLRACAKIDRVPTRVMCMIAG